MHKTTASTVGELFLFFVGAFDGRPSILTLLLTALYLTGIAAAVVRAPRPDRRCSDSCCFRSSSQWCRLSRFRCKAAIRAALPVGGLPFVALLAAIGFQRLRPAFVLAIVVAITTLGLAEDYAYYRAPAHEDWRGAISYMAAQSAARRQVAHCSARLWRGDRILRFAAGSSGEISPTEFSNLIIVIGANVSESPEQLLADSDSRRGSRIWLVVPILVAVEQNFASICSFRESGCSRNQNSRVCASCYAKKSRTRTSVTFEKST